MYVAIAILKNGTVHTDVSYTWRVAAEWLVEYALCSDKGSIDRLLISDGKSGSQEYGVNELVNELAA